MCGINGVWHTAGRAVDTALVQAVTRRLAHRGPDDEGFLWLETRTGQWSENDRGALPADLAFGFRRLAILDLSPAGHQPMSYADGNYWLVFNGEIYNYIELRDELKSKGFTFQSGTDTEVVLAAYAAWGVECLKRFNGMWAFALWDGVERQLFCARDRFGIKPFNYFYQNQTFAFASEIKALLPLMATAPRPNPKLIYDFLVYGWTDHTPETFFEGVQQLLPAHYLVLNDGQLTCRRYWHLDPTHYEKLPSESAYAQRFLALFEDAVRLHLRSDVAVGTCLSGGLDSSSIVCVANRLLLQEHTLPSQLVGEHQKTFSSCFDDARFDERPYIEQVLDATGAERNFVFPSGAQLVEVLPRLVWHQDEPFGSTSLFAQWSVMEKVAERGVRVLLDGQGGDELLGGYHHYFHYFWGALAGRGQWPTLWREIQAYRGYYALPLWRAALWVGQNFAPSGMVRWARQLKREGANVGGLGLSPEFSRQFAERVYSSPAWRGDVFEDYMYDSLTRQVLPALLRFEDRNSMAHAVEARVPFLDYRLVEFVAALPAAQKIHDATTKVVLRQAMRGILPEGVRQRRDKMGFVTPEMVWLKAELGALVRDVVHSPTFAQRGYFDAPQVQRLVAEHQANQRDIAFVALRWLTLELWFRQFIDQPHQAYDA